MARVLHAVQSDALLHGVTLIKSTLQRQPEAAVPRHGARLSLNAMRH